MPDCCAALYPTERGIGRTLTTAKRSFPSTGIDRGGAWGPLGHRDLGRCASWLVCPVQRAPFFQPYQSLYGHRSTWKVLGSWKGANGSHGAAVGVLEPFEPCAAVGIWFFGAVGQKVASAAECFEIVGPSRFRRRQPASDGDIRDAPADGTSRQR